MQSVNPYIAMEQERTLPIAAATTGLMIGTICAVAAAAFLILAAPVTIPLVVVSVALLTVGAALIIISGIFLHRLYIEEKKILSIQHEQLLEKTKLLEEQNAQLLELKNAQLLEWEIASKSADPNLEQARRLNYLPRELCHTEAALNTLKIGSEILRKFEPFREQLASTKKDLQLNHADYARELICDGTLEQNVLRELKHEGHSISMPQVFVADLPRLPALYLNDELIFTNTAILEDRNPYTAYKAILSSLDNNEKLTERLIRYPGQNSSADIIAKLAFLYANNENPASSPCKEMKISIHVNQMNIIVETAQLYEVRHSPTQEEIEEGKHENHPIQIGAVLWKRTVILRKDELQNPDLETMENPLPSLILRDLASPLYEDIAQAKRLFSIF